jgi:predicted oxidoreductase
LRAIHAAVDAGFTLFDLADIYGGGRCEAIFGEALRDSPGLRNRLLIASKCGIRRAGEPAGAPGRYDFSAEHLIRSVEQSLRRLDVETIDLLMLHRPDYLMDPTEVAGAFGQLLAAGKVRAFGVSNFRPSQVTALQRVCPLPLVVNQVEISLLQINALEDGTLDQCLAEGLTPMAWSPLAGGLLGSRVHGLLPAQRSYDPTRVNATLDRLAVALNSNREAVALAWLQRHPAGIQPVVGSVDPGHIQAAANADQLQLSREDWYHLVTAARPTPLP